MPYTFEDKQVDAKDAFMKARLYHAEVRDIYRHFMPFREPTTDRAHSGANVGQAEGAKRTDALFDGTGPSAAFAYVANMKADWMPAFQDFFKLTNGPVAMLGMKPEDAQQRQVLLDQAGLVLHALTRKLRATVTEELFLDHFAGTGALCMMPGSTAEPIRGFSVPIVEMALENGAFGDTERWWWKRKWKARLVPELFRLADDKVPDELAKKIKDDRNADVEVTQYTYWNDKAGNYEFCAWTDCGEKREMVQQELLTSPWITPRMFVAPGESFGRGLAHLGLPFVKTTNKTRELQLRAAAFALLGLWTRRNDGVFNPETAVLAPGKMWKVASNATGGQGPTLQRLDIPHNFDVSSIVIKDEREQIRRVLLDDELPELTDRVRSPTEIAGRQRRYERNRGGATTRLAFELVQPFVRRGADIMAQKGLLPKSITIDDVITQAEITAPAATAQRSDRFERRVSLVQIISGLFGPEVASLRLKVEELIPEMARDTGLEERFIRQQTESEGLQQVLEQLVKARVAGMKQAEIDAAAPAQPAAPTPELLPEAQYMNGGF